jgi:glucose uptake protein GlcU
LAAIVVCCRAAVIPTKIYKTGDGMFFQWVLCSAILMSGIVLFMIQCSTSGQCPAFEPLAALGGFIWCTGNIMVVPIIKSLGLAMGLVIWGSANLLAGWASGKFGLFGLKADTIKDPVLNYIGVALALASLVVSFFIRPTVKKVGESDGDAAARMALEDAMERGDVSGGLGKDRLLDDEDGSINAYPDGAGFDGRDSDEAGEPSDELWVEKLSPFNKQVFGVTASIFSGLLYGVNFDPPQYIIDHREDFPGAPSQAVELVFSHFVGIWLTSTAYMLIYSAYTRNAPALYPKVILPGFVSGVMWAVADISWFIANGNLQFVIAFPLITMGPGIVGALWGVFAFGEITGRRNYILLATVFIIAAAGAACVVASKG